MLFPTQSADEMPEAEANAEAVARRKPVNIAFVPLALPGTAGPGTIAFIISAAASSRPGTVPYSTLTLMLAPVIVFILLGIIFWVCLRSAGQIVKQIGKHTSELQSLMRNSYAVFSLKTKK